MVDIAVACCCYWRLQLFTHQINTTNIQYLGETTENTMINQCVNNVLNIIRCVVMTRWNSAALQHDSQSCLAILIWFLCLRALTLQPQDGGKQVYTHTVIELCKFLHISCLRMCFENICAHLSPSPSKVQQGLKR